MTDLEIIAERAIRLQCKLNDIQVKISLELNPALFGQDFETSFALLNEIEEEIFELGL